MPLGQKLLCKTLSLLSKGTSMCMDCELAFQDLSASTEMTRTCMSCMCSFTLSIEMLLSISEILQSHDLTFKTAFILEFSALRTPTIALLTLFLFVRDSTTVHSSETTELETATEVEDEEAGTSVDVRLGDFSQIRSSFED